MPQRTDRPTRWPVAFAVVCASVVAGLLLAEAVVRVGDFDWRLIERALYYDEVNKESLAPVADPELAYRPTPGRYEYEHRHGIYWLTVNSLGFRGPEVTEAKPPGTWRIVCLGGSNVWGAEIGDDDTWPIRLERVLNADYPGTYQVLNLGAPGYVARQMVALGREALDRLDPDVVIFALTNTGIRPFLLGKPIRGYFERDPRLWDEIFNEEIVPQPAWLSLSARQALIRRSRLVRLIATADAVIRRKVDLWSATYHEDVNVRLAREFLTGASKRARVFVFLNPTNPVETYEPYLVPGVDVFALRADDKPAGYRDIHPVPEVMEWYAEKMAGWMAEHGYLVPESERGEDAAGR